MQLRPLSLAAVSALVASGAWYTYKGDGSPAGAVSNGALQQNRGLSSSSYPEASASPKTPSATGDEAQVSRKALVVDNDQIYTGSIIGDGPLSKDVDDSGRKIVEMMTPDQATEKIRKTEESYIIDRGRGVVRYDLATLPSNDPIEDDHAEKIVEVPSSVNETETSASSSDWMFWGVFDGHSGWTTSAKLRQVLISFVARELNSTYKAASTAAANGSHFPSPVAIDTAIKTAFTRLDNEICHESVAKLSKAPSKRLAAELLAPALSGACALLSFYDTSSKTLRVACTGDSRAVLGRRNPQTGKWSATALSVDQTGSNTAEADRMRSEHPASEAATVIRNGRVLGNLEPSRAFGDAFYKWSKETQDKLKRNFFGRTPHPLLKTPPYVTAEPVITTTQIQPENGDFLVMATDGLWEMLTNEEVIGLVGQWIETQNRHSSSSNSSSWLPSWFSSQSSSLPVEKGGNTSKKGSSGSEEPPIRQQQWGTDQLPASQYNQRFAVEDKNAASHLIRNALGGKDRDMVCALLTLPSPYSRRYRDDLTVEVIFFGETPGGKQNASGNVTVNHEATAGGHENGNANGQKSDLKPKL
ncbi:putative protein phophatase 2c family protein [Phaeomoniella chlamydospora]|uniref:PPM-type phosphatase domain-containing protein n=1 Tax=Phaeomoniella chlamydospora TaxID=158046 RepID=A0A0G2HHQ7_PHACM|nr:putative protein phophatase 2c family protein [Phaeomoniella chlamydospora]